MAVALIKIIIMILGFILETFIPALMEVILAMFFIVLILPFVWLKNIITGGEAKK